MRAIHIFSIVLIIITVAACVFVINSTADFSPFSGHFGVTAETAREWGGEGLGAGMAPMSEASEEDSNTDDMLEATTEPTEEMSDEEDATVEPTEEAVTEEAEATAEATEE